MRIFELSPASRLCARLGWLLPGPVLLKMKLSLWATANQTISQILDCFCKISFQSLVILLSLHSIYFHWCQWHFRWFSIFTVFAHVSCSASWEQGHTRFLISIYFICLLTVNVFLNAQLFWILDRMSCSLIHCVHCPRPTCGLYSACKHCFSSLTCASLYMFSCFCSDL